MHCYIRDAAMRLPEPTGDWDYCSGTFSLKPAGGLRRSVSFCDVEPLRNPFPVPYVPCEKKPGLTRGAADPGTGAADSAGGVSGGMGGNGKSSGFSVGAASDNGACPRCCAARTG